MTVPQGDLDLLSIGELLIDFISVEETSSLREAYTFRKYQGGSPANLAVYVAKLGGKAALVSKIGGHAFGAFLKAELQRANVLTDYLVVDPALHSSVVFVSRTKGTPDFEAFRDADYQLTPQDVSEEQIRRARVVHASSWPLSRQPSRSAVEKAFRLAQENGKLISLDPNYTPLIWPEVRQAKSVMRQMLRYATLIKPSLDDAVRLFGPDKTPEAYIDMFHEMGPSVVVFTMGAEGVLLSENGRLTHIPARPIKTVDATGAGDSFWAGFLVAMLDGNPLERCALFAREIAERKLSTVGPLPDEIDRQAVYARLDTTSAEEHA